MSENVEMSESTEMSENTAQARTSANRARPTEALVLRQSRSPHGTRLVEATGEVDLRTAERFEQALRGEPDESVIVDLTRVTFFNSTGVESLIGAKNVRPAGSISLVLSGIAARVLRVAGVLGEFRCFESVDAAAHQLDATLIAWPVGV